MLNCDDIVTCPVPCGLLRQSASICKLLGLAFHSLLAWHCEQDPEAVGQEAHVLNSIINLMTYMYTLQDSLQYTV